ncbi:hypothetical protein F383_09775 [Gossypium arboreum]|uniref:Uncharacterized protein n=1 Tax=Gossypium arboreum TaxID=29729 RepID=A0A0B0PXI8_GOSAR|nr:hypothetical protein F383_09775 [Gossypium arboreum]
MYTLSHHKSFFLKALFRGLAYIPVLIIVYHITIPL